MYNDNICKQIDVYKLTAYSKKYKHNFTIAETCIMFAKWKAIAKFKAKHPHTTKITVVER